jgi:hypothetical protein
VQLQRLAREPAGATQDAQIREAMTVEVITHQSSKWRSPMIEFDEKGKATAEKSARAVEQSYSATADNMRDYSLKMIDMAQSNTEAVFEFARQLASAKATSDLATVWTTHARKQFEMLTAIMQRFDGYAAHASTHA